MDLRLDGLRVFVTAASKGIGRSCAEVLTREGAQVVLSSSDEGRAREAAESVGALAGIRCDLTSAEDIEAGVARAAELLGGLDAIVVNSGPPPSETFENSDDAVWDAAINGVLRSGIRLMRAAAPYLKESGRGRIVVVTGHGIREPKRHLVASEATRAGVTIAAKVLSHELGPFGVTVNNIAPDAILTDRFVGTQRSLATAAGTTVDEELAARAALKPLGRIGEPEDIANLCAFLCSPLGGYISGQAIVVDGGAAHMV